MATIEAAATMTLEEEVAKTLREKALDEIAGRGLTVEQLAEILEVFPDGARRLTHEPKWSVNVGLRVLGALGVPVRIEV